MVEERIEVLELALGIEQVDKEYRWMMQAHEHGMISYGPERSFRV